MPFLLLLLSCFFLQPLYADIRFLSISDFHYGQHNSSHEGEDTNTVLLASSLKKFSELSKNVDFILTLGDFPTHVWGYSTKKADDIKTVFHDLFKADNAGKPMFYITGNNDSLRGNYQAFLWNNESPLSLAKDWNGACVYCKGLIIDDSQMYAKGYYSSYVISGNKDVILIALNSTMFTKTPFFIPSYPNQTKEALQQLLWLEDQLKKHHAKQLLIAMHIPPGTDYKGRRIWHEDNLKRFIHLLNQAYSQYGQITLLTAHTHMDDIRKIHLANGKNIYALATPSISRAHYNYPAMKIFDLDTNLKLKNYTTYYTTRNEQWENAHYSATGKCDSVFPQCMSNDLNQCLDTLSNEQVCKQLQEGQFYGVKNPRVNSSVCKLTFPIT